MYNTVMKTPILPMRSFRYRALNLAPPRSYYNTIGGNTVLFCFSNCSHLLDSDWQFPFSSRYHRYRALCPKNKSSFHNCIVYLSCGREFFTIECLTSKRNWLAIDKWMMNVSFTCRRWRSNRVTSQNLFRQVFRLGCCLYWVLKKFLGSFQK